MLEQTKSPEAQTDTHKLKADAQLENDISLSLVCRLAQVFMLIQMHKHNCTVH